jgi:hypothetical protein
VVEVDGDEDQVDDVVEELEVVLVQVEELEELDVDTVVVPV